MLRREDSNKILKGAKVILFATSFSLLNPVSVQAQEANTKPLEECLTEDNRNLYLNIAAISSLAGAVGGICLGLKYKKDEKNQNKVKKLGKKN